MAVYRQERDNMNQWDGKAHPFFESYYLFCHVPAEQKAFWIQYSLLSPLTRMGRPSASLKFFYFDLIQPNNQFALKSTFNEEAILCDQDIFYFQLKESAIYNSGMRGEILGSHQAKWNLHYEHALNSFALYPKAFYYFSWPPAKIISPNWQISLSGELQLDGKQLPIQAIPGTQIHQYGTKHWNHWAWCHFNRFSQEGVIFEALVGELRWEKKWNRSLSWMILRVGNETFYFNQLLRTFFNYASYDVDGMNLEGIRGAYKLVVEVTSLSNRMLGMQETDTDGSKIYVHREGFATCDLKLFERKGSQWNLKYEFQAKENGAYECAHRSLDPDVRLVI